MTLTTRRWQTALGVAALAVCFGALLSAQDIPQYSVQFVGAGSPKALNDNGEVVGWATDAGVQRAWHWDGSQFSFLPNPPDSTGSQALDINEAGVIVGSGERAAVWQPGPGGYTVTDLGVLPGHANSVASAVNNLGDIVGHSIVPGFQGGPAAFFDGAGGVTQLVDFQATPADVNDNRQIIGGQLRMDLDTGVVEDLGLPPSGFTIVRLLALNISGQAAGNGSLSTSTSNNLKALRYTDGVGYRELTGPSRYASAYGINNDGDVVMETLCGGFGPAVRLEGVGSYCLQSLIRPEDNAWTLFGPNFTGDINNNGQIVVMGTNSVTQQSGAVLLTPDGLLQPPSAPTGLTAVPHEATWQQPWIAITLTWVDNALNETGFEIERKGPSDADFVLIRTVGPNTQTIWENTVQPETAYEYRIRAVGFAGPSAYTNVASAVSPSPPDTEDPVVTFLSPADGATVSGNVSIALQATDNVGATNMDISTTINSQSVQICQATPIPSSSTSITCSWNTKKVAAGTYPLYGYASDALGNWSTTQITVTVGSSGGGGGGGGGKPGGGGGNGGGNGGGKGKPK